MYRTNARAESKTNEPELLSPAHFAEVRRRAIAEAKRRQGLADSNFDAAAFWKTKVEKELMKEAVGVSEHAKTAHVFNLDPAHCNELVRFGKALGFECRAGCENTALAVEVPQ